MLNLPQAYASLLAEVLESRRPDLLPLVVTSNRIVLRDDQRDDLWEAIGAELTATGLDDNAQLTARGAMLDQLAGRLFDA